MNSIQKEILMSFFETNQYPTKSQKEELANKAGLSLQKVSDWFERQRKKHGISREKTVFECDQCAFQSTRKHDVAEHKYREQGLKCDLCEYKTALT